MRKDFASIVTVCVMMALHTPARAQSNYGHLDRAQSVPATPYGRQSLPPAPGQAPLTILDSWQGVAPCLASATFPAFIEPGATADTSLVDASIAGFRFRGQPKALVDAFRRLTSGRPRASAPAASACDTVECAVSAVFGAEQGPALLLLAATYHFDAAELADPDRPGGGLDDVVKAFGDMSASMFPLDNREYRVIARRAAAKVEARAVGDVSGEVVANAGVGQPGILLRGGWSRIAPNARRVAIIHELAHEFIRVYGRGTDWRAAWMKATKADMAAMPDWRSAYVSAYAQSNPDEDFAESFAAYRYMAPALKRRAPHRYALLRDWAFNGLEYGAATACRHGLGKAAASA